MQNYSNQSQATDFPACFGLVVCAGRWCMPQYMNQDRTLSLGNEYPIVVKQPQMHSHGCKIWSNTRREKRMNGTANSNLVK